MAPSVALSSLIVGTLFTSGACDGYAEGSNCPAADLSSTGISSKGTTAGLSMLQLRQTAAHNDRHTFQLGPHNDRQRKVVNMMKHAWKGYAHNCWGMDELLPLDGDCDNSWHLGLTLVDSLDTLYVMGLDHEFKAARNWVANRTALNFDNVGTVSLFETTIRVLGGLLSAHALSGDRIFLARAEELGDRLLPGFHGFSKKGPPATGVDLHTRRASSDFRDPSLAEGTSLALEFKTLTELTGSHKYAKAVNSVAKAIHEQPKMNGVAMTEVDATEGTLFGPYKLGAGGDSYYEYLLKQWLLTGRKESSFLQDYDEAMQGIKRHLVKKTKGPRHLTYVAEMSQHGHDIKKQMDHLACFLPGTLALGAHYGADAAGHAPWHMQLAKELMHTCYQMYKSNHHMLGPETVEFDVEGQELFVDYSDSHDLLRPETVESLFYLYRFTGDKKYQDWGWKIAQGIERYAKVKKGGYASLESVLGSHPPKRNKMESFFPAETLKYLFLLFDDSRTQVPLDEFVFNTEAHPLRIRQGQHLTKIKAKDV